MSKNNVTTPVSLRQFLYWKLTYDIYKSGQKWWLRNFMNFFSLEISNMCTTNDQTHCIYSAEKHWCNVIRVFGVNCTQGIAMMYLQFPSTANII